MKFATIVVNIFCILVVLKHTHAGCTGAPGCIYIMQEVEMPGTFYKVGGVLHNCGKQVDDRRTDLQTGNVRQLVVRQRYWVNNCRRAEAAAHRAVKERYGAYYGGGTEWYYVEGNRYANFEGRIVEAVAPYQGPPHGLLKFITKLN